MAYKMYLDGLLFPVMPSKLQMKIGNANQTVMLVNEGEVNLLKAAKLTEISFDLLLPQVQYPFAVYSGGFKRASHYMEKLEALKVAAKPFQYIVTRALPSGAPLFGTNLTVSLEDYTLEEDSKNGFDVVAKVKLKRWQSYGTNPITILSDNTVAVGEQRGGERSVPLDTHYVVRQAGESLWSIARVMYGDGSYYMELLKANMDTVTDPNNIPIGTRLVLPAK